MADKAFTTTNGGRLLKRGYTFDPECHRTTYRLGQARQILASMGIKPEFPEHDESCIKHPSNAHNRCFGWTYWCECGRGEDPVPSWPEWVTGRMFDLAYSLADEVQTERGSWNQREAYKAKEARRKAEREGVAS